MAKLVTVEEPLREKLGPKASESLIHLINKSQEEQKHEMLEFVEEKFERRLTEEIGKVNISIANLENRFDHRLTTESSKVNERLTEEIGKVNERMTEEIGKVNERMTEEMGKVNERMTEEMGKVNERMTEEMGKVNERMTEEMGKVNITIADVEKRLDNRITEEVSRTRADLIKWMFIFWIGQIGAMLGLLFAFFK
ncbi:MAG: DUF1640 domain-containing protein [candidate division KSB1 bacterium]|nr:DUF1640 domain-containing protein [candidate division KSB1 bacterium]